MKEKSSVCDLSGEDISEYSRSQDLGLVTVEEDYTMDLSSRAKYSIQCSNPIHDPT